MCFGCSKEPSHQDGSFEYAQHIMFWMINKENNFHLSTLIWGPDIFFLGKLVLSFNVLSAVLKIIASLLWE